MHVEECYAVSTAFIFSSSPLVHIILFVYHCEACDRIKLRALILRYCILVGRVLVFTRLLLQPLSIVWRSGVGRYEQIQMVDIW